VAHSSAVVTFAVAFVAISEWTEASSSSALDGDELSLFNDQWASIELHVVELLNDFFDLFRILDFDEGMTVTGEGRSDSH
jgi:hypothetical protein